MGIISKEMETLKASHKKVLEIKNCSKNEKFLWVHQQTRQNQGKNQQA